MGANRSVRSTRGSALWGTGNRGGERSFGARRGLLILLVGAFALGAPLAASAAGGTPAKAPQQGTYVQPALLKQAQAHGNQKLRVIIQAVAGTNAAVSAFSRNGGGDGGSVSKRLALVSGVAVELKAKWIARLAKIPGLVITPDAPVESTGDVRFNTQLWPYVSGNAKLWGSSAEPAPDAPTIAIVDSGLDNGNGDFGDRAYPQVNLSSLTPNAQGDGDGHGTFVAGIAADGADNYTGASPTSHILPIRVMDENGIGAHLRRDRGSAVDPGEQGHVRHQGRQLLAALVDRDALLLRPARSRGREALVQRDHRRRGGRQLRHRRRTERRAVLARQRSVRDHGRRRRHRQHRRRRGRHRRAVVGVREHRGRLCEARARRARPLHGRAGLRRHPRAPAGRPHRRAGLHGALGHVLCGPGRLGRGSSGPGSASGLVARPGEGCADARGQAGSEPDELGDRRRRAQGRQGCGGHESAEPQRGPRPVRRQRLGRRAHLRRPELGRRGHLRRVVVGRVLVGCILVDASWSDASWSDASWSDASWSDASWSDASWSDASWSDASWSDLAESEPVGPVPVFDLSAVAALQIDPDLALPPLSDTIAAFSSTLTPQ